MAATQRMQKGHSSPGHLLATADPTKSKTMLNCKQFLADLCLFSIALVSFGNWWIVSDLPQNCSITKQFESVLTFGTLVVIGMLPCEPLSLVALKRKEIMAKHKLPDENHSGSSQARGVCSTADVMLSDRAEVAPPHHPHSPREGTEQMRPHE